MMTYTDFYLVYSAKVMAELSRRECPNGVYCRHLRVVIASNRSFVLNLEAFVLEALSRIGKQQDYCVIRGDKAF